jgi:hypothetical protein
MDRMTGASSAGFAAARMCAMMRVVARAKYSSPGSAGSQSFIIDLTCSAVRQALVQRSQWRKCS